MSGTIPLSMTQQFDVYGKPLAGAKLYLIQAGTVSTPQNGFQDVGLTIPLPNPITLDSAGRIPQFFLADGLIKVLLQDVNGVVQLAADNILVIGPSGGGGGGGGGAVDPTTIYVTGDLKARYGTGVHSGFVRCNALTIGAAASGASERANADCQSLFQYLWATDPNLAVIGGRGASPNADWLAAKQITLPDWRCRTIGGMDGMGSGLTGRFTTLSFPSGNANVLGASAGSESHIMAVAELPPHFHRADIYDPGHTHTLPSDILEAAGGAQAAGTTLGGKFFAAPATNSASTGVRVNGPNGLDNTYSAGSGVPLSIVSPIMVATVYIKL